jgi:hypothetical protein
MLIPTATARIGAGARAHVTSAGIYSLAVVLGTMSTSSMLGVGTTMRICTGVLAARRLRGLAIVLMTLATSGCVLLWRAAAGTALLRLILVHVVLLYALAASSCLLI